MFGQIKKTIAQNLILTLALIVTLIVYFKFFFFGHISWDDPEMIFKNKFVKNFEVKTLFKDHFVGNYIPLTMFVHAVGWLLFENNDGAHHFINILFHLINGILVYNLGKRLFQNDLVANIGAIIFLLHPIQVESVGWISELKNVLSTTFCLAGLLYYLKYVTDTKKINYILCLLFFILGCLSKSSVVVFPLILVCIDIFITKSISVKFIVNKIPFLLLAIVFGLINIKTQTADLFINHAHEFPYYQRTGYAGFALLKYMALFLLPVNLSVIYPYPANATLAFVIGYAVITALLAALFFLYKKKKFNYFALILFTLVNLILVLQFIPFGEVLYADRYMYIPTIGFAWILALIFVQLKTNAKITSFVLIFLFALLSFFRSNTWRSAITLYEDILRNFPNSFVALNSVGVEYMLSDNNDKAFYYLNRSIQVAPQNYKGYYNRGLLYLKNQNAELAIKSFNNAIKIYDYPKAYVGRASAYHILGDFPKAINDANFVLKTEPNNIKAHFVLGNCYNELNRLDEAMAEYNKCIEMDADEAEYYFKRGIVFGKKQDFKSCINDINICLALNPAYYEAYYWRGVAKVNLKQNACEDFKIAAQKNYEPAIAAFNKFCR